VTVYYTSAFRAVLAPSAAILARGKLAQYEGAKKVPATVSAIADAVPCAKEGDDGGKLIGSASYTIGDASETSKETHGAATDCGVGEGIRNPIPTSSWTQLSLCRLERELLPVQWLWRHYQHVLHSTARNSQS
jgi:hypothetical protein